MREDGKLAYTQYKNRDRKPTHVVLDILPELAETLAHIPPKQARFILSNRGKPFKSQGSFDNWFREACRKCGIMKSSHGIRKHRSDYMNDMGIPTRHIMSVMGHRNLKTASKYISEREQESNAEEAFDLMLKTEKERRDKKDPCEH